MPDGCFTDLFSTTASKNFCHYCIQKENLSDTLTPVTLKVLLVKTLNYLYEGLHPNNRCFNHPTERVLRNPQNNINQ